MKRVIRWAALGVFIVLVAAGIAALWLRAALHSPYQTRPAWRLVNVPRGTSLRGLARLLERNTLISSNGHRAFVLSGILSRKQSRLQPGRYRLSPSMTPAEIMAMVEAGRVYTIRITVPEGFTVKQIAMLFGEKGLASETEFMDLAHDPHSVQIPFPLPKPTLEGYLFPDTYDVTGTETTQQTMERMIRRFSEVVWQDLFKEKPSRNGLTLHQAVTLASLVEGEARVPSERPLIAGVLLNRIRKGMLLQCDATVQYALGDRHARLLERDLKIDNPYNTYLYPGLPPGPIGNPGRASIEAALRPAASPYLFYVAKGDGSHVFTRTYSEHLAAIARIRGRR